MVSLPLGALALTEAHLRDDRPRPEQVAGLVDAVEEALGSVSVLGAARRCGARLVASGGTATALAALELRLDTYEPRRVHGTRLTGDVLAALVDRLVMLPDGARERLGALDPGRVAVLPAGALLLDAVLHASGGAAVRVSDHGVRHAYLRERLAAAGVAADLRCLWG